MLKIYINTTPEYCDYELEDMIDLDDFVITGNRDYTDRTDAEWYTKAEDILNDLDNDYFVGQSLVSYPELSREQRKKIVDAYNNDQISDDLEGLVNLANIIYPDQNFETATIRGYCQGDWQKIAYPAERAKDVKYLEAYYFGMVAEVHIDDDGDTCWGWMIDDELWDAERNDTLRESMLDFFGYSQDTPCQIYKGETHSRSCIDYEWIAGEPEDDDQEDEPENELFTACIDIIRAAKDVITPNQVDEVRAIFA